MEWKTIDSAPKDGTEFLAALSNGWIVKLYAASEIREGHRFAWWSGSGLAIPYEPSHDDGSLTGQLLATHWMPIPTPPQ